MADNRESMLDLEGSRIREPLYRKADLTIETSNVSPEESAELLLQALRESYS